MTQVDKFDIKNNLFSYISKGMLMNHAIWKLLFALFALALFSNVQAYAVLDTAVVTVDMPVGWKMVTIMRKPGYITSTYAEIAEKGKRAQSLSEIELKKEMGKDATTLIKEMADRINKQVIVQHCKVSTLTKMPQPDNLFNLWEQRIECKRTLSGIIQWYLDVDPVTTYLFTYTIPIYPFSDKDYAAAEDLLKKSIGICYKDKPCTVIK
jgi:hypothetical protein